MLYDLPQRPPGVGRGHTHRPSARPVFWRFIYFSHLWSASDLATGYNIVHIKYARTYLLTYVRCTWGGVGECFSADVCISPNVPLMKLRHGFKIAAL